MLWFRTSLEHMYIPVGNIRLRSMCLAERANEELPGVSQSRRLIGPIPRVWRVLFAVFAEQRCEISSGVIYPINL